MSIVFRPNEKSQKIYNPLCKDVMMERKASCIQKISDKALDVFKKHQVDRR